jgi:RNA polymerase sigma factor (sigma-70 family)
MEVGQVENTIYPRIILGLDISTACIGVSIVKDNGDDKPEILYLSHKTPKISRKIKGIEALFLRKQIFEDEFINDIAKQYEITDVVIEEPLLSSNNVNTVATLLRFNGMISEAIYLKKPIYSTPAHKNFEQILNGFYVEKLGFGEYHDDLDVNKIADTMKVSGRHISVDAPFVEGEDNSLLDVLVNNDSPMADRSLVNESLSKEIDRALDTLTEREKEIIRMFFGIGEQEKTLEEIGDRFNLTRERVRQIKEKAIRRLRTSSRSKLLKTFLG